MSQPESRRVSRYRPVAWALQIALGLLVVGFFAVTLRGHWEEFRSLELPLSPRWEWIGAAALVVWITYALLIWAWRAVLIGWGERLTLRTAAGIWCLSNLGRYLPGKIWSVAGLAVLARRAGVAGWAAAGSAVAMQGLALGTGAMVVALWAPKAATTVQVMLAFAMAALTLIVLLAEPLGPRWVSRLIPGIEMRPLSPGSAVAATLATLLSWMSYGVAFWLVARGLVEAPALGPGVAAGVFAAAYLVGLLAVFAPGGVGVRELMLVSLLTPVTGSGAAITLAVGSRLLLTITEAGAALASLALTRTSGMGVS